MMWLTWRQFRAPAIVTAGALTVLAIVLALTGRHLNHIYQLYEAHWKSCRVSDACGALTPPHLSPLYQILRGVTVLVVALPAITGLFWGAPLITRELENGTWRLAWTQSVSRRRWLAVKLAVVGFACVAASGLLTLMTTLWFAPFDRDSGDRFGVNFPQRGITPMAYAIFAFALAVALGVLIRRTLPAMAATVGAFVAARVVTTLWLRPHLMSPKHLTSALGRGLGFTSGPSGFGVVGGTPQLPDAWILSSRVVDGAGKSPTSDFLRTACPGIAQPPPPIEGVTRVPGKKDVFDACVEKLNLNFHQVVTYHPAGRYWTFQLLEAAVFVGLAGALIALTFWWTRHRLT